MTIITGRGKPWHDASWYDTNEEGPPQMAVDTRTSLANAILAVDAQVDAADAGTPTPAKIVFYTAPRPASVADAATGTALVEITLDDPAFGVGHEAPQNRGGIADALGLPKISSGSAGTGTLAWARVFDGLGTALWDGSVGLADSDFIFSDISLTPAQTITLDAWAVLVPLSVVFADDPGGATTEIQFNDDGIFGGFGSFEVATNITRLPGGIVTQPGGLAGNPLASALLAPNGTGGTGSMIVGARIDIADTPYNCFGQYEVDDVGSGRHCVIGGGQFGGPDANTIVFFVGPYNETENLGVPRFRLEPSGFATLGAVAGSPGSAWLEVKADAAQAAPAIKATQHAAMSTPLVELAHSNGSLFFTIDAPGEVDPIATLIDVPNAVTSEWHVDATGVNFGAKTAHVLNVIGTGLVPPKFTTALRPAAGIAGRIIWNTDDAKLQVDNGTTWETITSA